MKLLSRRTAVVGIAALAGLAKRSLAKPAQLCGSVVETPSTCVPGTPITKTIFLMTETSWVVPTDWNSGNNKIEAIAGGGSGAYNHLDGGGGGAYTFMNNVALTPGASIPIIVGKGGASVTVNATNNPGTNTNFNGGQIIAVAGLSVNAGGIGSECTPPGTSGGDGGGNFVFGSGGGGGGAGGPNGPGASGGYGFYNASKAGSGGGGADGGGVGQNGLAGAGAAGGQGGIAQNGAAGGAGGSSSSLNGANGTSGSGGGGGYYITGAGGAGSSAGYWLGVYGAGSGGGSGGDGSPGGHGSLFGGGGGAGAPSGAGGNGVIIITYLGIC